MQEKKFINKIVRVKFRDHTRDSKDLTNCEIFGILTEINSKKVVIKYWNCLEKDYNTNNEFITIIRSSIIEIKELIDVKDG